MSRVVDRDIIAVFEIALATAAWGHPAILAVADHPGKETRITRIALRPVRHPVACKQVLDLVEQVLVDNGVMFAGVPDTLVRDLTHIDAIGQDPVDPSRPPPSWLPVHIQKLRR